MNKQTIIGLVVIGAILFGFSWFQSSQQKKAAEAAAKEAAVVAENRRIEDSIALANAPAEAGFDAAAGANGATGEAGANTAGQAGEAGVQSAEGVQAGQVVPLKPDPLGETLAAARNAAPQTFGIANDVMEIEFSSLGGMISDVVLKGDKYKKYDGEPLHMWKPGSEVFDVEFFVKSGYNSAQVNTREFNFSSAQVSGNTEWAEGEEAKTVSMRLPVDSTAYVEFVYTIPRNDYMIGFRVDFVGMEAMMSNITSFDIAWANTSLQNEKGFDNENNYTTVSYHYPGTKGIEQLGIGRAGSTKQESEPNLVQWVAFKQQFFSSILIAENGFMGADMEYSTFQPGSGNVKQFKAGLNVPVERGDTAYDFRMYFGPNKFSTLKQYDLSMERLVPLGGWIIGWISRLVVIPLFDWLGSKGLGFGLIIFIMTLIIKIVISPLTFASYKSSAKMRVIKPEVDEINAKFPGKEDAMKKQQATMELYRRAGINPMAGCIPMLIQFPIIIAMFRFFPAAIELRGQRLWWAEDLSSYDSIANLPFNIPFYGDHISLFALLMAVSMFFYSWLNFKQQAAQPQMAGMKFMMLYMMPIMLLLWFNNYAAGLCFYYLISNLFTIAQMYGTRFFINEDKLRRKMLSEAKKPKKKSGFAARLEEMQKAQQAAARAQQQTQNKPTQSRQVQGKKR